MNYGAALSPLFFPLAMGAVDSPTRILEELFSSI